MEKGQAIRTKKYVTYVRPKGMNVWLFLHNNLRKEAAIYNAQMLESKGTVEVEVREEITIESVIYKTKEE